MFDLNNNLLTGTSLLALAKSIYYVCLLSSETRVTDFPTLGRKFDITHWFTCGGGRTGVRSRDNQNFWGG